MCFISSVILSMEISMQRNQCYCFSLLFTIVLKCVHALDPIVDSKYLERTVCNAQNYIDEGCFAEEPKSRSRINCFLSCSLKPACLSVLIYNINGSCYHGDGGSCNLNPLCSPKDTDFRYYERGPVETTETPATTQLYELTTEALQLIGTTEGYQIVHTTDAQQIEHTTEAQQIIHTTEAQQIEHTTEAHQIVHTTEAQQIVHTTETEQIAHTSGAQQIILTTEAQQIADTTEAQQTEAQQIVHTTEAQQIADTTVAQQIVHTTDAQQIIRTTEAQQIVHTTEGPAMETLETTQPPFQCEHNGIYNSFNDSCDCRLTGGYVGVRCERLATSCMELYNYPYASGAHPLNMDVFGDGSLFFQTTCHLKFWYATQASFDFMKSTGSFDAALSYNDYVSGFRFGPDDYWIGLENLHRYTSDGRNHKVRLTVNFNSSGALGEMCVAHYNFVVASATQGYSYTLAPTLYRGTTVSVKGSPQGFGLDDVLLSQENARFSAVDNDQDDSALTNCAEKAQAGWWFGQCLPIVANPFGWSYVTMPGSVTDQHFHVSGLDMSRTSVRDSVRYVYMSLDYPIGV